MTLAPQKGVLFGLKTVAIESIFRAVHGRWRMANIEQARDALMDVARAPRTSETRDSVDNSDETTPLQGAVDTLDLVSVVVCTRNRPEQFKTLMNALRGMAPPKRFRMQVIVVENEVKSSIGDWLEQQSWPWPLRHVLEPESGLCHARNRSFDEADSDGSHWIASIDDDETPVKYWLLAWEEAVSLFPETRIFTGPYVFEFGPCFSKWRRPEIQTGFKLGQFRSIAPTGNAFYHKDLFGHDRKHLRFDPKFNFTGGEDTELSVRISDLGHKIRWIPEAKIHEPVPEHRSSLAYHLQRVRRNTINSARIRHHRKGPIGAVFGDLMQLNRALFFGSTAVILATLTLPIRPRNARYLVGDSASFFAQAHGLILFHFGTEIEEYGR